LLLAGRCRGRGGLRLGRALRRRLRRADCRWGGRGCGPAGAGLRAVRRRMLLARELAVGVLVELVEVLLVRRALRLLARDEAVVVLVQVLEHLFRAGAGPRGGLAAARARR